MIFCAESIAPTVLPMVSAENFPARIASSAFSFSVAKMFDGAARWAYLLSRNSM